MTLRICLPLRAALRITLTDSLGTIRYLGALGFTSYCSTFVSIYSVRYFMELYIFTYFCSFTNSHHALLLTHILLASSPVFCGWRIAFGSGFRLAGNVAGWALCTQSKSGSLVASFLHASMWRNRHKIRLQAESRHCVGLSRFCSRPNFDSVAKVQSFTVLRWNNCPLNPVSLNTLSCSGYHYCGNLACVFVCGESNKRFYRK
jgi:hypothetical protein